MYHNSKANKNYSILDLPYCRLKTLNILNLQNSHQYTKIFFFYKIRHNIFFREVLLLLPLLLLCCKIKFPTVSKGIKEAKENDHII